jgi:hypothetical protein
MFCKTKTKPKVSEKKGATGQSFIRKEITCYRIGTLEFSSFWVSSLFDLGNLSNLRNPMVEDFH